MFGIKWRKAQQEVPAFTEEAVDVTNHISKQITKHGWKAGVEAMQLEATMICDRSLKLIRSGLDDRSPEEIVESIKAKIGRASAPTFLDLNGGKLSETL